MIRSMCFVCCVRCGDNCSSPAGRLANFGVIETMRTRVCTRHNQLASIGREKNETYIEVNGFWRAMARHCTCPQLSFIKYRRRKKKFKVALSTTFKAYSLSFGQKVRLVPFNCFELLLFALFHVLMHSLSAASAQRTDESYNNNEKPLV